MKGKKNRNGPLHFLRDLIIEAGGSDMRPRIIGGGE